MIKEFVCPNGRMSVNGVCTIFEGDDGQIKDFNTTNKKDILEFDFMKPTESAFESAGNIISNNVNTYRDYVENKLGIPANVQNFLTIGSAAVTGSLMPFAIPFLGGMALNNSGNNRIENITNRDTQGTINTVVSPKIMNIEPTAQDIARGGGSFNQPDGSGGYTGGFDSSTGNYSDPYSDDTE